MNSTAADAADAGASPDLVGQRIQHHHLCLPLSISLEEIGHVCRIKEQD
jgi:hypothetical protein